MRKIIIIIVLILGFILFSNSKIPDESIRFRIISSSNEEKDIIMKEMVKVELFDIISSFNTKNINSTRLSIKNSLESIENKIKNLFEKYSYNKEVNVNYGINHFPSKEYNGNLYEEGNYESLVINIGEAEGNNYWCVLYPPLCISDMQETMNYKSRIIELINKYFM